MLPLLFLWLVCVTVIGPSLTSPFWVIDEEVVPRMVRGRAPLSIPVFLDAFHEFGLPGLGQFRPGSYLLQALECFLLSSHSLLWHLANLALMLASLTFVYLGCLAWLPAWESAACALLLFVGPQNVIWIRLISGEVFGVPLVCYSFMILMREYGKWTSSPSAAWPAYVALGGAGFVKESFIPLLPLALGFAVFFAFMLDSRERLAWSRQDWAVVAASASVTLVQVAGVAYFLHQYGHMYHESLSPQLSIQVPKLWIHFFLNANRCLPLGVALMAILLTGSLRPVSESVRWAGAWLGWSSLGILLGLLAPQMLIYGGHLPGAARYLTPGNFSIVLVTLIGFVLLGRVASRVAVEAKTQECPGTMRRIPRWITLLSTGLAVAMVVVNARHMMDSWREAQRYAAAARENDVQIRRVAMAVQNSPGLDVVVLGNAINYEPIYSVPTLLADRLEKTQSCRLFLSLPSLTDYATSPHFMALQAQLVGLSKNGGDGYLPLRLLPDQSPRIYVLLEGVEAGNTSSPILIRTRY